MTQQTSSPSSKTMMLFLVLLLPFAMVWFYKLSILGFSAVALEGLLYVLLCLSFTTLFRVTKTRIVLFSSISILYALSVVCSVFEIMLYDFTGNGFNDEVMYHFEWEAFRVGFDKYYLPFLGMVLFVLLFFVLIAKLTPRNTPALKHTLWALPVLMICSLLLPVGGVIAMVMHFYSPTFNDAKINNTYIQQAIDMGVIESFPATRKESIEIYSEEAKHKNLILIYLESFNDFLLDDPNYPELTPHLNALSSRWTRLSRHLSSSYVTIEGIISSQCGTLLPMKKGNDSFMGEGSILGHLSCLGDVLLAAGYDQYYFGGADLKMAGKGDFLAAHGYQTRIGSQQWKEQGLAIDKNVWGLSDSALFAEAIKLIEEKSQQQTEPSGQPYNLTLLTLGTHLPGFVYPECEPYAHSDNVFIQAIHCTDQLVGKFVSDLEERNLLDNTLVMITADHGVFPNPRMTALFDERAKDRRLLTITNQPLTEAGLNAVAFSSYDLAPSLLDMLNIDHNVAFIYGRSLLADLYQKNSKKRKFVTRYGDWQGDQLSNNAKAECDEESKANLLRWPFDKCGKNQLLAQTQVMLESYSDAIQAPLLACSVDVQLDLSQRPKILLDGVDHAQKFTANGNIIKQHTKLKEGVFLLTFKDRKVEDRLFFRNTEKEIKRFKNYLTSVSEYDHALILVESGYDLAQIDWLGLKDKQRPGSKAGGQLDNTSDQIAEKIKAHTLIRLKADQQLVNTEQLKSRNEYQINICD